MLWSIGDHLSEYSGSEMSHLVVDSFEQLYELANKVIWKSLYHFTDHLKTRSSDQQGVEGEGGGLKFILNCGTSEVGRWRECERPNKLEARHREIQEVC